ncbi:MAG: hypothetical protein ACI85K_002322, partial [Hyphomicrobiaceae bacterium]
MLSRFYRLQDMASVQDTASVLHPGAFVLRLASSGRCAGPAYCPRFK